MARMPLHVLTSTSRAWLAQVTFAGKLYVTGRHACFHAPAEKVAFALAHDDMRSVAKLPSARGASAGAPECRALAVTLLAASWRRMSVLESSLSAWYSATPQRRTCPAKLLTRHHIGGLCYCPPSVDLCTG